MSEPIDLPGWMLYELHLVETEWTAWLHHLGFPDLQIKFDITHLDIYAESPGHNDDKNDIGVII